ncbi:TRAP-type mannitol/chloroaromatic compound transport system, small permease component [Desulfocicer vacuolatum DSM 3385]|uniref:TRAP-type mannitol/chloroaromatic compound transport system, small permease component n=2 Tax=Desulfocicer vacuolatum TaxID=2298 RepID=A0A1W2ES13_9BACT|nr:TRAP-type mannitol/chloroaromatic compound transport system, small permease component [Desulfocicer vacuolatum DSM 3385]
MMGKISQFNKIMGEMAGWIVVAMMLTISFDVAMRYLFNAPTTWSFEVNRYMLIMVVFLGGPWTLTAGGHVSVDLVTDTMGGKRKLRLDIVTSVMAFAYMLMFTWESMVFTWDAWENATRSTEYLAWPLWPIRMFLVVGGALLSIQYLIKITEDTVKLKTMKGAA